MWQAKIHPIPCAYPMPLLWGPSEAEVNNAVVESILDRWLTDNGGDEDEDEDAEEQWESNLLDAIESVALSDAYRL
jgi:hypothetical protein